MRGVKGLVSRACLLILELGSYLQRFELDWADIDLDFGVVTVAKEALSVFSDLKQM